MKLKGKRIAIFVEKLYNEFEFWYPYYRFKEEGAEVKVVAPNIEVYYGKNGGIPVKPDLTSKEIDTKDFDAVFIPEIDDIKFDSRDTLLLKRMYVGSTRAKKNLTFIASSDKETNISKMLDSNPDLIEKIIL